MRLEDIGFYTLSDERARNASHTSRLQRCEVLVTRRCNFMCPYCRRTGPSSDMSWESFRELMGYWSGLKNIRISGGEPTLWGHLEDAVALCRRSGVERIAISTNGSADSGLYVRLAAAGVNDFSVSLDACCASDAKGMAGGVDAWEEVVNNISLLSSLTYTTVGVVLTPDNESHVLEIVKFAEGLGVSDIRIIPSSDHGNMLNYDVLLGHSMASPNPILRYRISNMASERPVRGLSPGCNDRCPLVLDDMAVSGGSHFPCIIYLREGGAPIGKVGPGMREERLEWSRSHDTHGDAICSRNCLDVCRDYNNRCREFAACASEGRGHEVRVDGWTKQGDRKDGRGKKFQD